MPTYELTLRFDADSDQTAISMGVRLESTLPQPNLTIERLSRVIVTRMPADPPPEGLLDLDAARSRRGPR
jgi:hypothetical protein